jgi:NAD(P)-dependent dehydrogenase (short-subunit alcohol dehydrogenase family)
VRTDAFGVLRRHPQLCPLPAVDRQPDVYAAGPIAILVDDGSALCQSLASGLSALGWEIAVLRLPGARPRRYKRCRVWDLTSWDEYELQDAEDALSGITGVELCVYVAAEAPATWEDASDRLAHAVMLTKHVQLPLARAADGGRAAFITVSRLDGAFGLRGTASEPAALLGSLQGMVKTLASEAPELFCRALDIAPDVDDESAAGLVIAEAYDVAAEPLDVAYDGTQRQTIALTDAPPPRSSLVLPELTADDVLLVTGGARGVTAQCVKSLMRQTPCHVVLLGRTMLEEEPDWAVLAIGESAVKAAAAHHLRDVGQKPTPREVDRLTRRLLAQREIRANMADLQELGADADYVPVDITDAKAMAATLAPWAERITGIIHGAGVLADRLILDKTPAEVSQVLAVKLAGLRNTLAVAEPGRLRHLALFASVAGFFGNRGQVDYAMANAALNSVALAWKGRHPDCHVTAVNWGAWAGGMVTPQLQALFEQRGVALIPMDVGAEMFAEQFTSERMEDVVTVIAPAVPLGKRPHRALVTAPVVIERVLDGLQMEPVIQDHCLAGHPVLPATVALGWCINALERLHPGMAVAEARGFKVFKGVIFNSDAPGTYLLEATPQPPDGSRVDVLIGARGPEWTTPHYGGSFQLVPWAQVPASTIDLGVLTGNGESGESPYGDGTLFHGPALQGLRRTLVQDQTQLIAECQLAETRLANAAYDGRNYDPVLSDLLLQAPLVWVRRFRDSVCLPVSVEHIEIHERLPSAAPFLVVVDHITDQGLTVTCSVTACSPDGAVYERFSGVSVALSQTSDTKFSHRGSADVREQ